MGKIRLKNINIDINININFPNLYKIIKKKSNNWKKVAVGE